jgi:amyloid beta (A4) precursor protein-binding family B protein 2 (Fe65-like)
MQVCVTSLGWCELAEDDLTPENSSKAVNRYDLPINAVMTSVINYRCIVDLSSKENENVEKSGVWGNGRELILELDEGSLKLIDPEDGTTLNSQPIHAIRVWGVGRDNGRDFAYVSRDKQTRKHMCHVFRLVVSKLPLQLKCSTD